MADGLHTEHSPNNRMHFLVSQDVQGIQFSVQTWHRVKEQWFADAHQVEVLEDDLKEALDYLEVLTKFMRNYYDEAFADERDINITGFHSQGKSVSYADIEKLIAKHKTKDEPEWL